MKKVMMLTTTAYMSERFNRNNIMLLEEMGYEVHVVANFDTGNPTTKEVLDKFKVWIEEHHGKWISIPVTKSPADISNNYEAYKQIIGLIKENNYEFIHCHTPVGGVLGRFVAHRTHTKVIYTAHGFHFFKGAPLLNWLLYYPVERFLSRWTDMLITINQEDYNRAKKSFHAKKTEYIPGVGIDLEKFEAGSCDRNERREELGVNNTEIMLLSVGELSSRKNHEVVIRALKKLHDSRVKYFICGQGALEGKLRALISELELEKQVFLLGYCENIFELCQCADIFVFPSLQEGLPVALMEAMAIGLPVVCSNVRGNRDLIVDYKGGFFADKNSQEEYKEIIKKLSSDFELQKTMGSYNVLAIKNYSVEEINELMHKLYQKI